MSGMSLTQGFGGGGGAFMGFGDSAGIRSGAGPGDHLLERGQCAVGVVDGQLGVAESTEAVAPLERVAHLVGAGESGLGELDGLAGVAAVEGEVGAGKEESRIIATESLGSQFRGGNEVGVGVIDATGGAVDEGEVDVGPHDGKRVAAGFAEYEGLCDPGPGEREVASPG